MGTTVHLNCTRVPNMLIFFCSERLFFYSSTAFGHSKSTTATSGIFKGQEHTFVRSYSDRLLKCDLTLDMLSENEKVGVLMHPFIYLFYYCCMVDKKLCFHLSKTACTWILSVYLFISALQWSCWFSDFLSLSLWILVFTSSMISNCNHHCISTSILHLFIMFSLGWCKKLGDFSMLSSLWIHCLWRISVCNCVTPLLLI